MNRERGTEPSAGLPYTGPTYSSIKKTGLVANLVAFVVTVTLVAAAFKLFVLTWRWILAP